MLRQGHQADILCLCMIEKTSLEGGWHSLTVGLLKTWSCPASLYISSLAFFNSIGFKDLIPSIAGSLQRSLNDGSSHTLLSFSTLHFLINPSVCFSFRFTSLLAATSHLSLCCITIDVSVSSSISIASGDAAGNLVRSLDSFVTRHQFDSVNKIVWMASNGRMEQTFTPATFQSDISDPSGFITQVCCHVPILANPMTFLFTVRAG